MAEEREQIEVDIVCVGAGPATLATVYRLLKRCETAKKEPPAILILEKGSYTGAHVLSGAVMNPEPLERLFDNNLPDDCPLGVRVKEESFYHLSSAKGRKLPITPPMMKADGYPIVSASRLAAWLAEQCEELGAEVYPEMAAEKVIEEDGKICGVQLRDAGIDKNGEQKSIFELGSEVRAQVVVLGEGAHGVITEQVLDAKKMRSSHEQAYALGIKEIFETPTNPEQTGSILHSFGYPADMKTYGGGFVYGIDDKHIAVGYVTGLDYKQPELNPHEQFRAFKAHPVISKWLTGAKPTAYGAKILPEGGSMAVPKLISDQLLLVGDSAGLLDAMRLKGLHLAIESGICAGDALFACLEKEDYSETNLQAYPDALYASQHWKNFAQYRNTRIWFSWGLPFGMAATGAAFITKGLLPPRWLKQKPDHLLKPLTNGKKPQLATLEQSTGKDQQLDLLSDLYLSGAQHEEDQPSHLIIEKPEQCLECLEKYGAPCTKFCPAQVYEFEKGDKKVRIAASNCLHCKTCAIKCPMQHISWTLPEAGGGPRYTDC